MSASLPLLQDRSRGAGSGRQARTKQLDVHEVKAMRQKEADEARAAAAAVAAAAAERTATLKAASAPAAAPDAAASETPAMLGDVAEWEAELESQFSEPAARRWARRSLEG